MRGTRLFLVAAPLAMLLGACSAYTDHGDTIDRSAGDAIAANVAIQTIDPWPYASSKTGISADGKRVARATERYIAGDASATTSEGASEGTTTTIGTGE
jgi:hypothetical protein